MRPSGIRTSAAWLKLSTSGPRPDRCPLLFGRKRTAGLTLVCPTCRAANKEGAKFCNECGAPLALRCPTCQVAHRAGQKFCDECGAALEGTAVAPVPAGGLQTTRVAPELRLVSVLFVDLVGFTSLSESREAEDVRGLLEGYFDAARTIVDRYGGTVEKFIGDAVMAVWGAPVAREDDAERAVRAALELVDAVSVFGAEVGAPGLRARAGVVTGQVASLENPGEGLVVGDRVNTASRVQSSAEPGTVLVDEATRQLTSAAIAFEDAGEHALKGKRSRFGCGGRCESWQGSGARSARRGWRRHLSAVRAICGSSRISFMARSSVGRRVWWRSSGGRYWEDAVAVGVLELHRRARRHFSVAFGSLFVLWGWGRLSGRWRRWSASGSGSLRTPRSQRSRRSSRGACSVGARPRWIESSCRRGWGRFWVSPSRDWVGAELFAWLAVVL